MARGDFIYNEFNVCLNPEIVISTKEVTIEVAKAGKYWVTGCSITLDSAGCGSGCSIDIWNKTEDKQEAINKEINNCIRYVKSNLHDQKLAVKALKTLEALLQPKEEKNEFSQLSLF